MTWNELKTLIDEKLKTQDKSEDINVGIIDISYPRSDSPPDVFLTDRETTMDVY